jgi:16S rRNA processing protein RimM
MPAPILIAAVAGAFGVKGLVKLKTFTADPASVADYGPLSNEDGSRRFKVSLAQQPKGDIIIARLDGVPTREAAEAIKGLRLYIDRSALPPAEDVDDFYLADLIGLEARLANGDVVGMIKAVHNHGAGDILEVVQQAEKPKLFAFTTEIVPVVDIAAGFVVIEPPGEVEVGPEGEAEAEDDAP